MPYAAQRRSYRAMRFCPGLGATRRAKGCGLGAKTPLLTGPKQGILEHTIYGS